MIRAQIKEIAKNVLPAKVRFALRQWQKGFTHSWTLFPPIAPGGKGIIATYIDQLAARRVLMAIIARTDNCQITRWLDKPIWQYPLDAWLIQEVIGDMKPDVIMETGTYLGGSAYFFATLCDLLGHGEVISIDIAPRGTIPHPRITYLKGSSTDPVIVSCVSEKLRILKSKTTLLILDSDHSAEHVLKELETFAPLIPVGSYIHVQDGHMDILPICTGRPGPLAATQRFLEAHTSFVRDVELENRYVMTAHPYGWLKKIT